MKIIQGEDIAPDATGIMVKLTGDEVAIAIDNYLADQGITVHGPRTVRINGNKCLNGEVYVDPNGHITVKG